MDKSLFIGASHLAEEIMQDDRCHNGMLGLPLTLRQTQKYRIVNSRFWSNNVSGSIESCLERGPITFRGDIYFYPIPASIGLRRQYTRDYSISERSTITKKVHFYKN